MPTIFVEGKPYLVPAEQNLLHACLGLGFDIPYFCWHPALGSVGACRQCAVRVYQDENDTRGQIVMSCMTPVREGLRVSIDDPEVRAFRATVIEWMMTGHPHDCPVCDEGGHCHLQDMTVMTGHARRRYRFPKRTFRNQDLGPFLHHEMNRCIQCYRCVRYYQYYCGDHDLAAFGTRNRVFFGRYTSGPLESEFAGNLVEICPTGVFTDRTVRRHFARKWDLTTAPGICVHCGLGCNTIPAERYGKVVRVDNRYSHPINGYFLCDRGRFGYDFANGDRRVRRARVRAARSDAPREMPIREALAAVGTALASRRRILGIGSPRASLEANFALRALVGPENFHVGLADAETALVDEALRLLCASPATSPAIRDLEESGATFVLGEDVTATAPRLALALRQGGQRRIPRQRALALGIPAWNAAAVREIVRQERGPLMIATPAPTRLDSAAQFTHHAAPDDLARLGYAVAHALDPAWPEVPDLAAEEDALARRIAAKLTSVRRAAIVSGTGGGSMAVLRAAAAVAAALHGKVEKTWLCYTVAECNSMGLAHLGGQPLSSALATVKNGEADAVIVLENDLFRRLPAAAAEQFVKGASYLVVLDHVATRTGEAADALLPVATSFESSGTFVNQEPRAQRFSQVVAPQDGIEAGWRCLRDLGAACGRRGMEDWRALDDVVAAIAKAMPALSAIPCAAQDAAFRVSGAKIPRQAHRFSGRTAIRAHEHVSEDAPPVDPDSPLAFSMEGFQGRPPSPLNTRFWAPGWNSVQAVTKFQQEVGGPLRGGDPGVRLIPTATGERRPPGDPIPGPFVPRPGTFLAVPLHAVFGSDELSMLAPAVAARSAGPCVALNAEAAQQIAAAEGDTVEMTLNGASVRAPLRVIPTLPAGLACLTVGFENTAGLDLPAWAVVRKAEAT